MKKTILKKVLIISIIILAIIAFIYYAYIVIFSAKIAGSTILPCIDDYTKVAKCYYEDFEKYDAEHLVYSIPSEKNKDIICYTENFNHEIIMDEITYQSFLMVEDSYRVDKQPIDYISVYDGFVSFCNNNGRASYVYSVYGEKPEFISNPDKPTDFLSVSEISDNWHYVSESFFS